MTPQERTACAAEIATLLASPKIQDVMAGAIEQVIARHDKPPTDPDLPEIPCCPLHENLLSAGKVEPLDNCFVCIRNQRDEASSHLGAALMQTAPGDDQIIIGRVRDAYKLLGGK